MTASRAIRLSVAYVASVVLLTWAFASLKACCMPGDGSELLLILGAAAALLAWRIAIRLDRLGSGLGWWI
jgi:hypothetical protein